MDPVQRLEELRQQIRRHEELYYPHSAPEISDEKFDRLLHEVERLEEEHPDLVKKLYAAYKAAADWIGKHPDEASKLIYPHATPADQKDIASLIRAKDRLGLSLAGASDIRKEIEAVYKVGIDVGYFKNMPSAASIYDKPVQ